MDKESKRNRAKAPSPRTAILLAALLLTAACDEVPVLAPLRVDTNSDTEQGSTSDSDTDTVADTGTGPDADADAGDSGSGTRATHI